MAMKQAYTTQAKRRIAVPESIEWDTAQDFRTNRKFPRLVTARVPENICPLPPPGYKIIYRYKCHSCNGRGRSAQQHRECYRCLGMKKLVDGRIQGYEQSGWPFWFELKGKS